MCLYIRELSNSSILDSVASVLILLFSPQNTKNDSYLWDSKLYGPRSHQQKGVHRLPSRYLVLWGGCLCLSRGKTPLQGRYIQLVRENSQSWEIRVQEDKRAALYRFCEENSEGKRGGSAFS